MKLGRITLIFRRKVWFETRDSRTFCACSVSRPTDPNWSHLAQISLRAASFDLVQCARCLYLLHTKCGHHGSNISRLLYVSLRRKHLRIPSDCARSLKREPPHKIQQNSRMCVIANHFANILWNIWSDNQRLSSRYIVCIPTSSWRSPDGIGWTQH